jgi:FkbM family methyltransferase
MTRSQLVTGFLESQEFHQNHTRRAQERVQTEKFVISIDPTDVSVAKSIAQHKTYEPHVTAFLQRLLKPEHVFLDVGCNIGWFVLLAASIAKKGKVIGLEPNQNNLQLLYQSINENRFNNIVIFPYAATDRATLLQMSGHGAYGFVHSITEESSSTYVQGVAIDELLRDETRLDVIKLDIEGHEPIALQGMSRTIAKHRPLIVSEFHPKLIKEVAKRDPQGYLEAFVSMGYSLSVLEVTGTVTDLAGPSEIMTYWHNLNQQFGTGDSRHLDILAGPIETALRP